MTKHCGWDGLGGPSAAARTGLGPSTTARTG